MEGARGIGLEVSRALAEAGAHVAIVYRTTKAAHERAAEIARATGVSVQAFQSDVRSRETIANTINTIADTFGKGRLDIVVANVGVCAEVSSLEYDLEQWQHMNSVKNGGVMWTAQAAGRIFKRQNQGNLIITASVSPRLCNIPQTQAAYNSSKAAAAHLARCLAVEWADFARVNAVSPGYVNTLMVSSQGLDLMGNWLNQIPARRVAQPQGLKGVFVFLASNASSYMTWSELFVDGAYSLV